MNYEVLLDGNKIELTEEQMAQIEAICGSDSQAILTSKRIDSLSEMNFLVKDYQRGYRWTETEVQALLDDINSISIEEEGYCMQPLVVKQIKSVVTAKTKLAKDGIDYLSGENLPKGIYELLDGQQRLTTIWLISSFLNNGEGGKYSIYYELIRNVDKYYIGQAYTTIRDWFASKNEFNLKRCSGKKNKDFEWNPDKKNDFISKFHKLFFIWYEVTDENLHAEKVFKNINEGKIELTNAELFKALLLNPENVSADEQYKLQQIAFEWDKVENGLRDDEFWYFISQDDVEKTTQGTRIDYVVEIYARELNTMNELHLNPDKDRFSFLAIQKSLDKLGKDYIFENIKDVWEHIVGVYDKLFSWYNDYELYHTVGFLVASEDRKRGSKAVVSEIVSELYQETRNMNVDEIRKYVRKKINNQIIVKDSEQNVVFADRIMYEYESDKERLVNKSTLRKILLFTNIYSLVFHNKDAGNNQTDKDPIIYTRFPFMQFNKIKTWDIEHISPKTVENDISKLEYREFMSNLRFLYDDLEDENQIKKIQDYFDRNPNETNYQSFSSEFSECTIIWKDHANELLQSPDNNLRNLVLLNASINRRYGNKFFNQKRNIIIEEDQKGVFIPPCTKNVFMKYYSDSLANPTQWTDDDKMAYKSFIDEMITHVKEW